MILNTSTMVATMGMMDATNLYYAIGTTLLSVIGTLIGVIAYLYKAGVKRDKRIEAMVDKVQEIVVQNTVAYKDLQGEIKLLRGTQETLQALLVKELAK